MDQPTLLDIDGTAARLGTSPRHVRVLIQTRRIPFIKVGGLVRFDLAAIDAWLEESTVPVGGVEG